MIGSFLQSFLSASNISFGFEGSRHGKWVKVVQPVYLVEGSNELALLSETVGLQNYGAFIEKDGAGFKGQIKVTGMKAGEIDLSNSLWTYQVGLKGELKKLYAPEAQENADWTALQLDTVPSAFTWYKTSFDAPEGNHAIALNLGSMGKGQAWVNGHGIGRFWSLVAPKTGCPKSCNYRGAYNEDKCTVNCGKPTQIRYHIPREWLRPSNNLLVLFEETSRNPLMISLKVHSTKTVCAEVSEDHYPPLSSWSTPDLASGKMSINKIAPEVHLRCDDGQKISAITFASYGNPSGSCGEFSTGKCHALSSLSVVSKACKGQNRCSIGVSNEVFGDPCRRTLKSLAVQAECRPTSDIELLKSSM